MNEYMIVVIFPSQLNEEFISRIPEQRAEVNRLMEKGVLTSYSLSSDRKILWITMLAASREAAEEVLKIMPLYKFMKYEVVELLFHNNPIYAPMHFSMN